MKSRREGRGTEPAGSGGEEAGDEETAQVVPLGRVQIALLPSAQVRFGVKRTETRGGAHVGVAGEDDAAEEGAVAGGAVEVVDAQLRGLTIALVVVLRVLKIIQKKSQLPS